MEFKTSQHIVRLPQPLKTETAEHGIESELILPDSYGDIGRILKCKAEPMILSTKVQGTTATVEGTVGLQLLYVNTEGGICCYTQPLPFYHEIGLPEGTTNAHTTAKTDYCNCRAISTRKVEIRGAVSMKIDLESAHDLAFITDALGGGVQLEKQDCPISHKVCTVQHSLSLTDEIQIDSGSIHSLLRCKGTVTESQYKCIGGKVLINGTLEIHCLYRDTQGRYCPLLSKLPFSQVVEAEGVDDSCTCATQFQVTALELRPRTGLDGECKTLLVNADIQTRVCAIKTVTLPLITDGFSTRYGFSMETYKGPLHHLLEMVEETQVCKKQLDVGREIGSVVDIWWETATPRVQYEGTKLTVNGMITLCALLTDTDQIPFYMEKPMDFQWEYTPKEQGNTLFCQPTLTITNLSYSLAGDTLLDLRVHLQVQAPVYKELALHPATNIQVDRSVEGCPCPAPLVVYFAKEGEPIFQIARNYSTTVGAIMEANNLTEPCAPGGALLVPACKE